MIVDKIQMNILNNENNEKEIENTINKFLAEKNIREDDIINMVSHFNLNSLHILIFRKGDRKILKDNILIESINQELINIVINCTKGYKEAKLRYGQYVFNTCYSLYKDKIDFNIIAGSEIDCFYKDDNVSLFLNKIKELLLIYEENIINNIVEYKKNENIFY